MYGLPDLYTGSQDESFGVLFQELRSGVKEKQIAYILGKLKEMYEKGRMDKAQRKAERLGAVVARYQEIDPAYQPDEELLAWISFGNGEIADPNDYFEPGGTAVPVTSSLFDDAYISVSTMPVRRYMPRRRAAPRQVRRSAPRRAAPRRGGGGGGGGGRRTHGPTPRMGGLFDEGEDESVLDRISEGRFDRKSIDRKLKQAKRKYDRAVKMGDWDERDKWMGRYEKAYADWAIADAQAILILTESPRSQITPGIARSPSLSA